MAYMNRLGIRRLSMILAILCSRWSKWHCKTERERKIDITEDDRLERRLQNRVRLKLDQQ